MALLSQLAFLSVASALPSRVSRRVAVIGGGSGGVVAARFLKKAGHKPVLFEAGKSFGGVWADSPTNAVVYKNLQTNLPTVVMQSPDLDFDASLPSYINKRQLGEYIERYADTFGVAPLARFGATVTSVRPVCDADAESAWEVEWSSSGETQAERFDAVLVANGHYEQPYKPTLPGEVEWLAADPSRTVVHSREYDDPEVFRGRSVLVVGGRSSGVDISRELRGVAKWVTILEKNCIEPRSYEGEAVTHVPLGTRLCSDGQLRLGDDVPTGACTGASTDGTLALGGPPVDTVVLATGYVYAAELVRLDSWLTPPRTTLKSSTLDRHQVLVPLPRRDGARHALPRQAAGDTALPAYAAREQAHAWLCRHTALRAMPDPIL